MAPSHLMSSRYASLTRAELAVLVPELLLMGQMMDRAGMPWCISAFGREGMTEVAIEEWMTASPIYTRRMQQALGYAPEVAGAGDVVTIFKGLQLDIGAPPQFMDFRYRVTDPWHGEFWLDHCGALMDVEPLGPDYVRAMCHDIEDPTFDATAVATNPRAQVRPVHRPPRTSAAIEADQRPHCRWTTIIDESHPEVSFIPQCLETMTSRAATLDLEPVDASDDGLADYRGPLLSDLDFGAFSHSALVRVADEVCLQMHLLFLGFAKAVQARCATTDDADQICRKQLTGIAGISAERIGQALGLTRDAAGALRVLELHPLLNPAAYVDATFAGSAVVVRPGPADADRAWVTLCGPEQPGALRSLVWGVSPQLDAEIAAVAGGWRLEIVERETPAAEPDEVAVTRFSKGASFQFEPRRSLPLFPV